MLRQGNIVQTQQDVTVISATRGWLALDFKNVWTYRELLYFLVWRDVKVRYKQTALGAAWALLQPLAMMIVFSVFFGRLAGVPSDHVAYPLFTYAGLLPWGLFSGGVTRATASLVNSAPMIKKVYFPRITIPLAAVLIGLVDFGVALLLLAPLMLIYQVPLTLNVLWLPLFTLVTLAAAAGVGLWAGALNVQFRDIGYIIPFAVQLWLFITPIAYPITLMSDEWRLIYSLNPMAGAIEGFRWALFASPSFSPALTLVSALVAFLLLITGWIYFRRVERTFADIV
ncbi:MAG: ABC transporter permease [Chloroflexi bacterium]|nr:ABC transporter permease [Chloroflexota bacterium]